MSAIDQVFSTLKSQNKKAFMPFVTAGFPSLDFTAKVLQTLSNRGSSLCELGIPYSDPIADGPVIQASYTAALDQKIKLKDILQTAGATLPKLACPVVSMVSYAIIYRHGLQRYVEQAKAAGIAGAIVPDLPVEEATALSKICQQQDFSLIQLITPTTTQDRAMRIAETSTGFIYYVSVTGITGERTELPPELVDNVAWLKQQTELPICIGFGISKPEHVQRIKSVCDGVIVGSAIVRKTAEVGSKPETQVLQEIGDYAESLITALNE